jgi:hypothetical protein
MLIYIVIYSILIFSVLVDNRETALPVKKIIIFFLIMMLTLFRGLRWNTGTDWHQFYNVFCDANWGDIFTFSRTGGEVTLEYGYVFLNVLIKKLGGNYTVFLLITNFIILYSYYKMSIFANKRYPVILFALFVCFFQFFPVRQHLAAAILLFSLPYIINKKFLPFIFIVFIASTIHIASIFFVILFFFSKYKIPIWGLYLLYLITIFINSNSLMQSVLTYSAGLFSINISAKMLHYQLTTTKQVALENDPVLYYAAMLFFLTLFGKIRDNAKDEESKSGINLFLNAWFLCRIISSIFADMYVFARMADYFRFAFPVLIAILATKLLQKYKRSASVHICVCGFLIIFMYYKLYTWLNFYPVLMFPYNSIFDGDINR